MMGNSHVTISLGRGHINAEPALLRQLIELFSAIERETDARVVFDVQDPEDWARLAELWSQSFGLQHRKLPLDAPAANDPWRYR